VLIPKLPRGREWIAARLPHRGSMCLLDTLLACDGIRILCSATSHRDGDNPLRAAGRLGAACAVEYAAQAMALHAALLGATEDAAPPRAEPGMLVAVRDLRLAVASLDALVAALDIACERIDSDRRTLLYRFAVTCAGAPVAEGRATLVIGLGPAHAVASAS
jgi:predicted hotdog family 3-hydroxylacyl-ACP dehydratase